MVRTLEYSIFDLDRRRRLSYFSLLEVGKMYLYRLKS